MTDEQEAMNPYEGFKLLRDHAPVTQLEEDGPWQVARHADVHAILRDHETFSSEVSIRPPEERGAPSMLFSDPPVHHRLPDRIRAHAMICFLALVLYRVMRMRLKAKGHSASPRTALDLLERIQQHVARIGPATKTTLTRQQPEQLDLFDALNLKTPN